jgi:hypothetical protein
VTKATAAAKKKKEPEKPPARPIVHPRFKEGGSDHQVTGVTFSKTTMYI